MCMRASRIFAARSRRMKKPSGANARRVPTPSDRAEQGDYENGKTFKAIGSTHEPGGSITAGAKRQPPTPAQIQAEQTRVLEADKARAAAPANIPAIVKQQPPGSPAEAHARYLEEIAPASIAGRLLKFAKEGIWRLVDDETEIGEDIDLIALCNETVVGWIKFNGPGNPPSRTMGLLYDGYVMPPRESLGDLDEAQWEIGLDGQPADPWVHTIYLVLQRLDNSELVTFAAMSKTARRAVGVLLRHYDRMQRTHPGFLPLVRLKVGGYQHRDTRVGWVKTPVIAAVGQVPGENAVKPPPADFADEIPW